MIEYEELSSHVLRLKQWLDAHDALVQEIIPFSNESKTTSIKEVVQALNQEVPGSGNRIISQINTLIDSGCGIATYRRCSILFPRHQSILKERQLRQLRIPQIKVNRLKRQVRCVIIGNHSFCENPALAEARSQELFKNMSYAFPTELEIVQKKHVCSTHCADSGLTTKFNQSVELEIYWKTEFLSVGPIASQTESLRRAYEAYQSELISRTH